VKVFGAAAVGWLIVRLTSPFSTKISCIWELQLLLPQLLLLAVLFLWLLLLLQLPHTVWRAVMQQIAAWFSCSF